ncbi:MAG: H-X9-DG-CTERM domain-containing protein [Gemmataceae bacterium]
MGYAEAPLPDFDPSQAIIWNYVEGNRNVFKCPNGVDLTVGSPTRGKELQLSYCMSGVVGGPVGQPIVFVTNGNGTSYVMLGWEHGRLPVCATNGIEPVGLPSGLPWPLFDPDGTYHYPERHMGKFHVLFCDGHVECVTQRDLSVPLFYVDTPPTPE